MADARLTDEGDAFSLPDQQLFVQLYDRLHLPTISPPGGFKSLVDEHNEVYKDASQGYTTVLGMIARLSKAVAGDEKALKARALFPLEAGRLVASPLACTLAKHFRVQLRMQECAISEARQVHRHGQPRRRLRVGVPQSLNERYFGAALGDYAGLFPAVEFEQVTDSTLDLLLRLEAGLLDVVFTYRGPLDPADVGRRGIVFHDCGFRTDMVLLCHPKGTLPLKGGEDRNAGYWEEAYRLAAADRARLKKQAAAEMKTCRAKVPSQRCPARLREVPLNLVDAEQVRLVHVEAWTNPAGLQEFVKRVQEEQDIARRRASARGKMPPPGCVILVPSWDAGLSYVRRGQGVMVCDSLFRHREHVTAFALKENLARPLGCYMVEGTQSGDAGRFIRWMKRYFALVAKSESAAHSPPTLGDEEYDAPVAGFVKEEESPAYQI